MAAPSGSSTRCHDQTLPFEQNQSTNYGGAIVIHDDDAQSETTIENCVFTNNRSVDGAVPSGVGGIGGAIAI